MRAFTKRVDWFESLAMLDVRRELRDVCRECLLNRVWRLWSREGRIWKLLKDSPRARAWAACGLVSCSD